MYGIINFISAKTDWVLFNAGSQTQFSIRKNYISAGLLSCPFIFNLALFSFFGKDFY